MSISKSLLHYTKRVKRLNYLYLLHHFGCTPDELTIAFVEIWDKLDNPFVFEQYIIHGEINDLWYYEICNTPYVRGEYIHENELYTWCKKHQFPDMHHSVYTHDKRWIEQIHEVNGNKKVGGCTNTKVKVNWLPIELDRKLAPNSLYKAMDDAYNIVAKWNIDRYCSIYYSGNNSIHLMLDGGLFGNPRGYQNALCGRGKAIYNTAHAIAGDIRYNNNLVDAHLEPLSKVMKAYYNQYNTIGDKDKVRQAMENLDPALYDVNSLIRLPFSWHEIGRKQKTELTMNQLLLRDTNGKFRSLSLSAPPLLLHIYFENYERKVKPKKVIYIDNLDLVSQEFGCIPDFDPNNANPDGWVNKLYSPFYDDSNPSVGVNIKTGFYKDFGNPEHTFNFLEFLAKKHDITINEVKQRYKL